MFGHAKINSIKKGPKFCQNDGKTSLNKNKAFLNSKQ